MQRLETQLADKLRTEVIDYQVDAAKKAYLNATQAELQLRERFGAIQAELRDARQRADRPACQLSHKGVNISRPGVYLIPTRGHQPAAGHRGGGRNNQRRLERANPRVPRAG